MYVRSECDKGNLTPILKQLSPSNNSKHGGHLVQQSRCHIPLSSWGTVLVPLWIPASFSCTAWEAAGNGVELLGSCLPCGRPRLSSGLLDLALPSHGCWGQSESKPANGRSLPVPFK